MPKSMSDACCDRIESAQTFWVLPCSSYSPSRVPCSSLFSLAFCNLERRVWRMWDGRGGGGVKILLSFPLYSLSCSLADFWTAARDNRTGVTKASQKQKPSKRKRHSKSHACSNTTIAFIQFSLTQHAIAFSNPADVLRGTVAYTAPSHPVRSSAK